MHHFMFNFNDGAKMRGVCGGWKRGSEGEEFRGDHFHVLEKKIVICGSDVKDFGFLRM